MESNNMLDPLCASQHTIDFVPEPIDTSDQQIPAEIAELTELLAHNTHAVWAARKLSEGWRYGPHLNETSKHHPDLIPYETLPESVKEYDRATATETIKVMLSLGYHIRKGG